MYKRDSCVFLCICKNGGVLAYEGLVSEETHILVPLL